MKKIIFITLIISFFIGNIVYAVLTGSIVSYWNLDDDSNDAVGSNDGSDTSITYSEANGLINEGAGFNGSSSLIDIDVPVNFNEDFTINFWFNAPTNSGDWHWFMDFNDNGTAESQALTITSHADLLRVNYGTWFTSIPSDFDSQSELPISTWTMVTLLRDGDNMKTYVNASQKGSTTATTVSTIPTTGTMHFGRGPTTSTWYAHKMDEIGVWDRVLTGAELTELYNSGDGLQYPFGEVGTILRQNIIWFD